MCRWSSSPLLRQGLSGINSAQQEAHSKRRLRVKKDVGCKRNSLLQRYYDGKSNHAMIGSAATLLTAATRHDSSAGDGTRAELASSAQGAASCWRGSERRQRRRIEADHPERGQDSEAGRAENRFVGLFLTATSPRLQTHCQRGQRMSDVYGWQHSCCTVGCGISGEAEQFNVSRSGQHL